MRSKVISLILLTLSVLLPGLLPSAHAGQQRFEVMHFWTSSSEQDALKVLRDEFVRRYNVQWVDAPQSSFDQLRKQTLQRIIDGYPPNAVLWHPSAEVWNLHDMDVIHTLTDVAQEQRWKEKLPRVVMNAISFDGEVVAVPTNIHGENLVWYSAKLYKRLGLEYPENWQQLLKQAQIINEAGHIAVAIGEHDWEKRLMYSAILNSLSPKIYRDLLTYGEPTLTEKPEVLRAFQIMATLRDASRTNIPQPDWTAASTLIGGGRAGMQFAGDWVSKELRNRGQKLGIDYECRPFPGEAPVYMIVVDGFMLPVTGDENDNTLHSKFARMVMEPETQVKLALAKGAIPVVKGVSDPHFDKCSRFGIEALKDESRLTPSSGMLHMSSYGNAVQSIATQLWLSNMTPPQAVKQLHEELVIMRELRRQPGRNAL